MTILRRLRKRLRAVPVAAYLYHRLRQALLPLGAPAVRTPYGFRFAGHPEMTRGTFEPDQVAIIRKLLMRHDVLVDIGANIGFYTCHARALGREAIAVEPLAANLRLLKKNLSLNGWDDTPILPLGLAAAPGRAEIYGTDTGASLLRGWASLPDDTLLRETIALDTLDRVLARRYAGKRLLVKIDVEGAEAGLLRGAGETLTRTPAPTWVVEISLTANFPGGFNPAYAETFEAFFGRGYRAWTANAAAREVRREEVRLWQESKQCGSGADIYVFSREAWPSG